jgi:hypothetical protein
MCRDASWAIAVTRTVASQESLWSIANAHKMYGAGHTSSRGYTKTLQRPIASMLEQLYLVVGVQDSKKQNAAKTYHYNNVQEPCT